MESKTRADKDIGSYFPIWRGESSKRRNKENQSAARGVRTSWRRKRVLLVPEQKVPIKEEAAIASCTKI